MRRPGLSAALLVAVLLALGTGASSRGATVPPSAKASAYAIQVIVPGAPSASAASVAAPPDRAATGSFSYGSGAVVAGSVSASAFASPASPVRANAAADITGLSLFGGEITADSITARSRATASPKSASGETSGTAVSGLQALGQPVGSAPGTTVALADWGSLTVIGGSATPSRTSGLPGYRAAVLALHVQLTADHGGLPAGTDIFVGYAETTVQAGTPPAAPKPAPTYTEPAIPARPEPGGTKPATPTRSPGLSIVPPRRTPPTVQPKLTAGGYVFPVYGQVSWSDTFGAPRGAPVGWHHGVDIFAPLGAPVLAVADGTLFSVGWNDIGGLRLWLRDRDGNEFYYAHLSAFATGAVDGAQVRAGQVIGFVGKTGDAEGTPYHLHFEIHPVSMLYLGYDGAVNPTRYLLAWQKLEDVPIEGVIGWAPPIAPGSAAPKPGAFLLRASDISSASGLDPASLRRALRGAPAAVTQGSLARPLSAGPQAGVGQEELVLPSPPPSP